MDTIYTNPALLTSGSFVAAVGGAFLLLAWYGQRDATPMLWWGLGSLAFASGFPFIIESAVIGDLSTMLGGALFALGPGLIWAASRDVNNREIDPVFIGAGPVIWIVAFLIPSIHALPGALIAINQALVAAYMFVAAAEFYDRAKESTSRQPLVVLLTIHGLCFSYGAFESIMGGFSTPLDPRSFWFAIVHFETLTFVIGTSMFAVAVAREQSETARIVRANTDELTGLANRRAFYARAGQLFPETAPGNDELSVVLFDLDAFKEVNDAYGHLVGDRVLSTFGEVVKRTLRNTDVAGRIGGDEFVVVLPRAAAQNAKDIADRVRVRFTMGCKLLGIEGLDPTLSAGVAAADGESNLDTLIGRADVALYRAKSAGRDRIEVFKHAPETVVEHQIPRAIRPSVA